MVIWAAVIVFFVSACFGVLTRFGLVNALNGDLARAELPFGTLLANVISCFLVGILAGNENPYTILAVLAGLGSMSTWSSVANEVAVMLRADQIRAAFVYLFLSISSGVSSAWLGLIVGGG